MQYGVACLLSAETAVFLRCKMFSFCAAKSACVSCANAVLLLHDTFSAVLAGSYMGEAADDGGIEEDNQLVVDIAGPPVLPDLPTEGTT